MADPPRDPEADGSELGLTRASPGGTPRWVKVCGIVALIVVALFVVLLVIGGPHNPGRHTSAGSAEVLPVSVHALGERQASS